MQSTKSGSAAPQYYKILCGGVNGPPNPLTRCEFQPFRRPCFPLWDQWRVYKMGLMEQKRTVRSPDGDLLEGNKVNREHPGHIGPLQGSVWQRQLLRLSRSPICHLPNLNEEYILRFLNFVSHIASIWSTHSASLFPPPSCLIIGCPFITLIKMCSVTEL